MDESSVSDKSVGIVVNLEGNASAVSNNGVRDLAEGNEVFQGEKIVTSIDSQIEIRFLDNTSMSQGESSEFTIDAYAYDPENGSNSNLLLQMGKGVFRTVTGEIAKQNPDNFNLKSPMAVIGIRGTTVVGDVQDNSEKWGAEQIGEGHVLVIQDVFGNIQFISEPSFIIDFLSGQPINPARPLTAEELDFFQQTAPIIPLEGRDDIPGEDAESEVPEGYSTEGEAGSGEQPEAFSAQDFIAQGGQILGVIDYTTPEETVFYSADDSENSQEQGSRDGLFESGTQGQETEDQDDDPVLNDEPTAGNDVFLAAEDSSITLNVLGNDTDPEGGTLSIISIGEAENGTLTHDGTYITYTPLPNYIGQDSFTYTISDGQGGTDTATVTITVAGINDAPEAVDDTGITTEQDTSVVIDALANDSDIEGDSLTIVGISGTQDGLPYYLPSGAEVVINNDGTLTYTPASGFSGEDTFEYTVSDGYQTDTGTVSIYVSPQPDQLGTDEDDILYGTSTADSIYGLGGNDTIFGLDGDDSLFGGAGNDFLYGESGNDTFFAADGNDYIDGGDNTIIDTVSYENHIGGIYVSVNQEYGQELVIVDKLDTDGLLLSQDMLTNIEYIRGTADDDTFYGDGKFMIYEGGQGDDIINGGLNREYNDDPGVSYWNDPFAVGSTGVTVDLGAGRVVEVTDYWEDTDTLYNIHGIMGSRADDSFYGQSGSHNWFLGGQGDDEIHGGDIGEDLDGNISIYILDPGSISATLTYDGEVVTGLVTDGWGDTDTLTNITEIWGSAYDDYLEVNSTDNFYGEWELEGGQGSDTLTSNDGWNTYAVYENDISGIYVDLSEGYAVDGWGDTDEIIGINHVEGSEYDDTIVGNSESNILEGGSGNDTLTGGRGNDIFVLSSTEGVETILDFTVNGTDNDINDTENDIIAFYESREFGISGKGEIEYGIAGSDSPVDPTDYQIIGVIDTAQDDWSDTAALFTRAVSPDSATGANYGTYLLASNGTDTRLYFWEEDDTGDGIVEDDELTHLATFEDFTDINELSGANFITG